MPRLTKIASAQYIGQLLNSHTNGARLIPEPNPPGALPVKPGVAFFRLETAGDYWMHMVSTGSVAIYLPFDPGTVQLALYAVDPETLQ